MAGEQRELGSTGRLQQVAEQRGTIIRWIPDWRIRSCFHIMAMKHSSQFVRIQIKRQYHSVMALNRVRNMILPQQIEVFAYDAILLKGLLGGKVVISAGYLASWLILP